MSIIFDLYGKTVSPSFRIMTRIPFILSLLALLPASGLLQNTWYVPNDFLIIQVSVDSSSNGDTVIVRGGNHFENLNFHGKNIALQSEVGPSPKLPISGYKTSVTLVVSAIAQIQILAYSLVKTVSRALLTKLLAYGSWAQLAPHSIESSGDTLLEIS